MEYLRSSVNLRAYGQRDPLVEYKKEGLRLFQGMEETYALHVATVLPQLAPAGTPPQAQPQSPGMQKAISTIIATPAPGAQKEYGRNDRVKITNGAETREMKYKKAEPLLRQGWRIVQEGMETRMG